MACSWVRNGDSSLRLRVVYASVRFYWLYLSEKFHGCKINRCVLHLLLLVRCWNKIVHLRWTSFHMLTPAVGASPPQHRPVHVGCTPPPSVDIISVLLGYTHHGLPPRFVAAVATTLTTYQLSFSSAIAATRTLSPPPSLGTRLVI